MPNYFDDSHLAEIGEEYERFVGAYFEKFHACMVIYQGRILGKQDGGIDLVAISKGKTYLIQCKNYLPSKLIHENVVNQLSGSAKVFASKFPSAKNVTPVLVYTCHVDDNAIYSAKINGVVLKRLDYQKKTVDNRLVLFNSDFSTEGYEPISSGLNMLPDYEIRLKAVLDVVQEHQSEPDKASILPSGPVFTDPDKPKEAPSTTKTPVSKGPAPDGKYFIRSETPLTYHYVQRNFLGPLNILSTVGAFSGPDYTNAPWLIALDSIPVIAIILFMIGASRFTKYSYWSTLVWRFFSPLCYAIMILISLIYNMPDFALSNLPVLVAGLVWAIPTFIYYRKRKALFFPELIPSDLAEYYGMDVPKSNESSYKQSFYTQHSTALWTFGLIAVFLLIVGSLSLFGRSADQATSSSPTATVKPTATPEPLNIPANGDYQAYWPTLQKDSVRTSKLTVKTPNDGNYYCLTFVGSAQADNRYFSVFVYPGTTIEVNVPERKNLLVYITCGENWYGYDEYFGANGSWSTSDDLFDFATYNYTLTLAEIAGGDWETEDIKSYEVPFLD